MQREISTKAIVINAGTHELKPSEHPNSPNNYSSKNHGEN